MFCFSLAVFTREPTSSQRKPDFIQNNGRVCCVLFHCLFVFKSAIYVLSAQGSSVVSSMKIAAYPQDSCCSKTHGEFRHPCIMLILLYHAETLSNLQMTTHMHISMLYFKIGKRNTNIILSSTFAVLGKMLSDRTSQKPVY